MDQTGETSLKGVLERIRFFNEENSFCIGELVPEGGREGVFIKGVLPNVQCGETLLLEGHWVQHPLHGRQFEFKTFRSLLPATVHGIRKYLGSGLVPGIGKHYADRIVEKFGERTFEVISKHSAELRMVEGIGEKRAKQIKEAWDEQQAVREVMMFLQTYGVTVNQCLRLVKRYGASAKEVLLRDPYQVAREVEGIGFKTADKIALNLGFANDSQQRLEGGILHALRELEDDGHTGYPPDELRCCAASLLESDESKIADRLAALLENKSILQPEGSPLLQLPDTAKRENYIAESVRRLLANGSRLPPIKIEAAVAWAQERMKVEFAPEQAEALRACLTAKMTIITGGPGTGKTSILHALVDILQAKKVRINLASPTGRAAQRLTETTGQPAHTIHRLLHFDAAEGRFTANEDNPLACDFLIVDEVSMLDTWLAAALFRAVPSPAHVVLVGDANQLPSVGAGNVLKDLIHCGRLRVIELTKIFRQREQSGIVAAAHAILNGVASVPNLIGDPGALDPRADIFFIRETEPEKCLAAVIRLCRDVIPQKFSVDPVMDVQVIAPMHKGVAGISNLNRELQKVLNHHATGLQVGGTVFHKGDKVIQTRNNYEKGVFNGDLGKVTRLDAESATLTAEFNGEDVVFERLELADLLPAYAVSIHKAQGSEFPMVVIPLLKQNFIMLQRNLLYTAVTRGKKKVFLVGDPVAYAIAVRNKETAARQTDLCRKLQADA